MTPTMTTLAKTIVGKAVLGVAVLAMGVGVAVASGGEVPVPNPDEGSEQIAPADDGSIDESSPVEVPEWKSIKAKGRAGWHALRDESRTEWLSAKSDFVAICGDDDEATEADEVDEATEVDEADGSTELSAECQALQAEIKALKESGKAEWKAARDAAKAEWKAAKDEAKTAAREARDEAKAERSAARAEKKDKSGKPDK